MVTRSKVRMGETPFPTVRDVVLLDFFFFFCKRTLLSMMKFKSKARQWDKERDRS